ncbi:MAG TPA: ComEA family DNA-binding protein [Candidatus Binatia bacterium]|jgi:competence protein ComEA
MNRFGFDRKTVAVTIALGALLAASHPALAAPTGAGATAPAVGAAADASRVDVNTANAEQLASLPGIGAVKAAAIIAEREKKPFISVDDLVRVRGIGPRMVEDLRGKVSVSSR